MRKRAKKEKQILEISLWVGACFFSPLWTAISMNTVSPPSRVHSSCSLKRLWMLTWEVVTLWEFQRISQLECHLGQMEFFLQKHSGWTSGVRHVKYSLPDRDCVLWKECVPSCEYPPPVSSAQLTVVWQEDISSVQMKELKNIPLADYVSIHSANHTSSHSWMALAPALKGIEATRRDKNWHTPGRRQLHPYNSLFSLLAFIGV